MLSGDEQHEVVEEQEKEEMSNLFQESINEAADQLGITSEEILETLGDWANVIPLVEPAQITDLYNEVEGTLYEIQLNLVGEELAREERKLAVRGVVLRQLEQSLKDKGI